MKKRIVLFTVIILTISTFSFSQNTVKKYQYVVVTIEAGTSGKWKQTEADFGTDYPVAVDKKEEMIAKIRTFHDGVDVLNYLGSMGWEYTDRQILFSNTFYVYTFKKSIEK